MQKCVALVRSCFAVLTVLFFILAGCIGRAQAHELVANPDDLQIEVKWPGGIADEDGDRVAGPAKIAIFYQAPGGGEISSVKAKLKGAGALEKFKAFTHFDEPPPLFVADPDNPTLLQPEYDANGVPTGQLKHEVHWPTRRFHNGPHLVSVGLEVTVSFVDGHTQVLNYIDSFTPIVCNLTVTDLTGVTPLPPALQLSRLGEPQDDQAVSPLAAPSFALANGGSKTFTCVVNSAMAQGVRLRYEIFSCDDPGRLLVTHEEAAATNGLGVGGLVVPSVVTWTWDGTKTIDVWDEFENYHQEQVPVERGLYQVRITAEAYGSDDEGSSSSSYGGSYGGSGTSVVDSDCTRSMRTHWPHTHWESNVETYGPNIHLTYGPLLGEGKRQLNVRYALHQKYLVSYEVPRNAAGVRLEAFTRVYEGSNGPLERVGTVAEGAAVIGPNQLPFSYNGATLEVPWNEKINRAEKLLLTARDQAGFDRGHREKWNMGMTRMVTYGEAEAVIYQVTSPASATQPEGLRRVTGNQIVGGKCYVGLEVEISPNAYLTPEILELEVKELPDSVHGIEHAARQERVRYTVENGLSNVSVDAYAHEGNPYINYANRPRWEIWNAALLQWQEAPSGPRYHRSPKRERWRTLIPWHTNDKMSWLETLGLSSTRSTLPGHNGSHQVKWHSRGAAANYGQAGEFAAFGCDEVQGNSIGHNYGMLHTVPLDKATDKANVQNLVFGEVEAGANGQEGPKVKTNVNEDYFIFDPTSDDPQRQQPQFQFKIEDQGDPHQYKWTIYIQPTAKPVAGSSVPSMAYLQGTTTGPQVVEVSWNGQAYNGTGPLMPRGAYTFDIYIEEVRNLGDSTKIDAAELKTPYCIDFSEHSVEFTDATTEDADDATNPDTTEDEDDDNDPLQARITYKLSDCANANAQKVTVHLLDHDLNLKAAHNGGTLVNHRYENVSIYDFDGNETDGVWRGIFMAVDKHGDNTRDHQNRHCWAVNKLKVRSPLYVMIDPGHGRYRTENGTLGWRRPEVGGIHEDDLTLGFARVLRTQLSQGKNKSMFIVRQIRDDVDDIDNDVERSWELRWQITESWYAQVASKLDLMTSIYGYEVKPHMVMTSIHTNGSETSPTAHGTETYYKSRDNLPALTSAGRLLSEKIHSRLVNQAGRASRDAPITNYAIFRGPNPHIPYTLTEVAFHTNTQPWAEGVIPENDLLRHNFSWTPGFAAQGGNVSFLTGQPGCSEYLCPKWWGYSTAMPAMANGVKDYYKAQKNAP